MATEASSNSSSSTTVATPPLTTVTNPFYINPNEALSFPIKLTGTTNYNLWSRTVRVALKSKNKLGFITGSIPIPDPKDASYQSWEQSNTTVYFLILGSLDPSLVNIVSSQDNSKLLWDDLRQHYGQADNISISDLQTVVYTLKQGNKSVNQFYSELKGFLEELVQLLTIPSCECGGEHRDRKVSCVTETTAKKYRENEFVTRFITGLNETYGGVKTNLLMMVPLPTMETSFHYAIQHERQVSRPGQQAQVDFVALLANNQAKGKGNAKGTQGTLFCRYCKKDNHVISDCYKLKRKNKETGSSSGFAGQLQGIEVLGGGILPKPETRTLPETTDSFTSITLSNDDIGRLQRILNLFGSPSSPTSLGSPGTALTGRGGKQSGPVKTRTD
ncbi:unnamed protein product [Linum trigynum]|uniref:Retrotransposon Copia-like N-terminal domain-containing protein n=1 Tax=Linum trigynum TaxID=586398 RepID=A0AAV2CCY8_9ROSI